MIGSDLKFFYFLFFISLFIYFKEQVESHLPTLVLDRFVKLIKMRLFFNFFFFLDCVEENIIWWKVINKEREYARIN